MAAATACASGASALVLGARLIGAGLADAVIAGGADLASEAALRGFDALELISPRLSNPLSRNRSGVTLGSGAALFLLSRAAGAEGELCLLGWGESADAFHSTAPRPDGSGAAAAMRGALAMAAMRPEDIGYVNLHGTGTVLNDRMEALAMASVFGGDMPLSSSTKPVTGHTLGAAGALELAFCALALDRARGGAETPLPVHCWDGLADGELPAMNLVAPGRGGRLRAAMSNSFAFGGCNVSLIIGGYDERYA
jgi:3-oxoacyl-[acyl-carrier-protein] synthase-1